MPELHRLEAVQGNQCPGAESDGVSWLRDSDEEEPVVGLQHGRGTRGAVLKRVVNRSRRDSRKLWRSLGQRRSISRELCLVLREELSAAVRKQHPDGLYTQPGGSGVDLRDQSRGVENVGAEPSQGVQGSG
ncbi:hypothetical protein KIL84_005909 [Mauremys mutica]|uniref:Uncharacterized protein n=1 Tax=Mauremys mutica TaxID=74926 RepID=A0A9D3XE09_9SAUR|nr:hypothetical protein KIL84_005909 [Mauremys mutica]